MSSKQDKNGASYPRHATVWRLGTSCRTTLAFRLMCLISRWAFGPGQVERPRDAVGILCLRLFADAHA